jgi:hypothetical protein
LPWSRRHGMGTTFGIFQSAYQGTPISSFIDLGTMFGQEVSEGVDVFGRGQFASMSVDPTTGAVTLGTPHTFRTPWFTQTDFNLVQSWKTSKKHEAQEVAFELNVLNLWNQHAVTNYYGGMNSTWNPSPILPGGLGLYNGAATYQAYESGYNVQQLINTAGTVGNSWYGQPYSYQSARTVRFTVRFSF